ncbi:MAG: hypothetical protein JRF72_02210 [Deltaproteobacteria bacterium]|jgi:hypothetical protein|nr:hypothetical protein [Deltaproteobacteria bacterium]
MMRFLLLIRNWIIGLLLAGAAVFFSYQTFAVWSANDTLVVDKSAQKKPRARAERRVVYHRAPRFNAYEVIAQKNLFSRHRREQLPETSPKPSAGKQPKPLDNRFTLFGIVIKGNEKAALVSNLNKKDAADKNFVWVKVGDKIGNLNVTEIESEQILLTAGGQTYTVRLSDQNQQQRRSSVRKSSKPGGTGTKTITIPKVKSPAEKRSKTSS